MSSGTGFNGCYASHIVIRPGTRIIKLPDVISDGLGATINCALATMVNCVSSIPENVRRTARKVLIQVGLLLYLIHSSFWVFAWFSV